MFLDQWKQKEDFDLKTIRSAGRALLCTKKHKIPAQRISQLENLIKNYLNKEILEENDIKMAAEIDPYIENENFVTHGKLVVDYFAQNEGILQLEKMWRMHFLQQMKPKFLPKNWSIDHQEDRLFTRKDEERIDPKDLDIALGNKNQMF